MLDGLPVVSEIIETSETWMKLHWFLLHRGKARMRVHRLRPSRLYAWVISRRLPTPHFVVRVGGDSH
jgi:hypothetical protein